MRTSSQYSPDCFTLQKPRFGAPPGARENSPETSPQIQEPRFNVYVSSSTASNTSTQTNINFMTPVKKMSKLQRGMLIGLLTTVLGGFGTLFLHDRVNDRKPVKFSTLQGFESQALTPETLRLHEVLKAKILQTGGSILMDPSVLAKYMKPAIVLLSHPGLSLPINNRATGFFCSSDGLIATNRHVAEKLTNTKGFVRITLANGQSVKAKHVASSRTADLALFKINPEDAGLKETPYLLLQKSAEPIALKDTVGKEIYTMGYYADAHNCFDFRKGNITSISNFKRFGDPKSWRYEQTKFFDSYNIYIPGGAGSSGSPILDDEKQVIGIMNAGIENIYGAAIPVEQLHELIEEATEKGFRRVLEAAPSSRPVS